MDELPYRTVINLQPALGELGHQAAQGEVSLGSFQRPDTVFAGNRLRSVAAYLAGRHAAGLALPSHPQNGRADSNLELLGGLIARQPAAHNRGNYPLPKV
jgi:hypothetical protein